MKRQFQSQGYLAPFQCHSLLVFSKQLQENPKHQKKKRYLIFIVSLICKSQSSSSFYFCLCVIASTPVSFDNHVMFIEELFSIVQLCNSETDHPPPPPAPSSPASQVLHWSKHLTFHSIGCEMKINKILPIKELTLNLGIRHLTPSEFVRIQSFLFSG